MIFNILYRNNTYEFLIENLAPSDHKDFVCSGEQLDSSRKLADRGCSKDIKV